MEQLGHLGEEPGESHLVSRWKGLDHKGAHSRAGPHEAFAFEVPVGLEHGVGIDRQLAHDLLGRGQLFARLEHAEAKRLMNLLDEL